MASLFGLVYSYSEICLNSSWTSSPVSSLISRLSAVRTSSFFLTSPPGRDQSEGWMVEVAGLLMMRNFVFAGFLMIAVTTVFIGA